MSTFQLDEVSLNRRSADTADTKVPEAALADVAAPSDDIIAATASQGQNVAPRRFGPSYTLDFWHRVVDAALVVALGFAMGTANPLFTAAIIVAGLELVPNLYQHKLTLSILDSAPRAIFAGSGLSFAAVALTTSSWPFSAVIVFSACVSGALFASRAIVTPILWIRRRTNADYRHRTLIVGAGSASVELVVNLMEAPEHGLEPIAFADRIRRQGTEQTGLPTVNIDGGIAPLIRKLRIKTVIIGFSEYDDREVLEFLRDCVHEDAEVFIVPRLFDYVSVQGSMDRIKTFPLIRMRRAAHRSLTWRLKRPIDAVLSGLALLALSPVLAMLAALVKLEDREAPVLFRQTRIGENGHEFELLKFRSMKPAKNNESDTHWSGAVDPRMTKLGSVMRKYSLDELPQIYNVLRGEMAIVGPRPERPHFVDEFGKTFNGYLARHRVPVGLTGFAAINGLRGDTSIRDRAMFDNFYIENWSLWLDVKIVLGTFKAVFTGSGA